MDLGKIKCSAISLAVTVLGLCSLGCNRSQPSTGSRPGQEANSDAVAPIRTWERQELREPEQRKVFATLIETEAHSRGEKRHLYGLFSEASKRNVEPDVPPDRGIDGWSLNKVAVQYHITETDVSTIAAAGFKRRWTVRAPTSPIRRDDYEAIADGMSYVEVLNVLGRPGEDVGRSNVGGIVTTTYKWSNPEVASVTTIFQNGRLLSKAQTGLP